MRNIALFSKNVCSTVVVLEGVWTCCWTLSHRIEVSGPVRSKAQCYAGTSVPVLLFLQVTVDKPRTLFFLIIFSFPLASSLNLLLSHACVFVLEQTLLPILAHIHSTFARLNCLLNFTWEIRLLIHLLLSYSASSVLV